MLAISLGLSRGAPFGQVDGLARRRADAFYRDHIAARDNLVANDDAGFQPIGTASLHRFRLHILVSAAREYQKVISTGWATGSQPRVFHHWHHGLEREALM